MHICTIYVELTQTHPNYLLVHDYKVTVNTFMNS